MSSSSLAHKIEWLWTWSGKYFGYRDEDALYSYKGRQIGRFAEGDEIYGHEGNYLGEIWPLSRCPEAEAEAGSVIVLDHLSETQQRAYLRQMLEVFHNQETQVLEKP